MEPPQADPLIASPPRKSPANGTRAWAVVTIVLAILLVLGTYLVAFDSPVIVFLVRLYRDKHFLKETVASWGWLAPVGFMAIQALQVIISPFPGEVTGPVGGVLFGTTWGLIYSTVGLTVGTLLCFWMGRKWGEPLVRPFLSDRSWHRLNFIIEAEGAIICLILYLIPGFPKDIISYLFGISPMPFWLFAIVSTLGRLPGTWISSYFGANVGEQHYIWALVFIAFIAAISLPLYYYRDRVLAWLKLRARRRGKRLTQRREAQ